MAKYHITAKGNPGVCRAKIKCPFGDLEKEHYATKEEARTAFEKKMEESSAQSSSLQKPKQERAGKVAIGNLYFEPSGEGEFVTSKGGDILGRLTPEGERWRAYLYRSDENRFYDSKVDAIAAFTEDSLQYKIDHQPKEDGAQGHNVETHFPDFYSHPEWYTYGLPGDDETVEVLKRIRGNPDARVTIYRALPHEDYGIEPGNWVSLSKAYAEQHALQAEGPAWPVVSLEVTAKEVRTPGDDINEWGYFPSGS